MTILAPAKHVGQVEQACIATLQKWMRAYIGLVETEFGYQSESLPDVRRWGRQSHIDIGDQFPERSLPYVTVVSPGKLATRLDNDDVYDATWDIRVGVILTANTEETTRDMVGIYEVAVTALLLQQSWVTPADDPFPTDRWVLPSSYDVIDSDKRRTIAGVLIPFGVQVDGVINTMNGPTVPIPDPPGGGRPDYPEPPTAEDINITVDAQEG